jgi:Prokaryotic E2 family C/ThiF family
MSLAEYYDRAALAASQIIAGFAPDLFQRLLEDTNVGIAIDRDAASSAEGKVLAELSVRLLARLYPCLELRAELSSDGERLESLARTINPRIEFKSGASIGIAIGSEARDFQTTCFAGSDGWDALNSMSEPLRTGRSPNPLGASAAACLAVGRIFNLILEQHTAQHLTDDVRLSTFLFHKGQTPSTIPNDNWQLPEDALLVGVGAVGNAAVWVLGRSPAQGTIHLIDHERLELSNLQRYVLAARADVRRPKVDIAAPFFIGEVKCAPNQTTWADFVEKRGYEWQHVLVAVDSAADRRSVQATLPRWIANAWTQPGDLGVSVHERFDGNGACLACLYLPTKTERNEDELVAAALAIPQLLDEVRTLLHTANRVGRPLLEAVAHGLHLPLEEVLYYEGKSIRELYVEGICGGGLIPLGMTGLPRQELHVPLAHQSALAGVLLAAALLARAAGKTIDTTMITRIDVTRPLGDFLTQATLKAHSGMCICADQDYVRAYQAKFGRAGNAGQ